MIGRAGAAIKSVVGESWSVSGLLAVYMDSFYSCNSFMSKHAQNVF